jgi:predicted metal-dependent hydrolase
MIDWLRRAPVDPRIELGDRVLPIEISRHARARRLTLRLAADGRAVKLTVPRWASEGEAIAFAHARAEWLAGQLARVPEASPPRAGGTLLYRGGEYTIAWRADAPRKPVIGERAVLLGGPETSLATRLQRWLEGEARRLMEADLAHFCARAGAAIPAFALSRAQRRWGSCSTGGTVRLNWRLVQAPDAVRRSVVAHEVAHLVHFDHSRRFHALLAEIFDDDLPAAERWLKAHGRRLYATFG